MSSSNAQNNNGVFGNSLIDDATLVKPLTESLKPLDIKPAESNTQNYDPFAPLNDKSTDSNTESKLTVAKPLEQPSIFNQPDIFPVVTQPTSTNNNKNTDALTGNNQNTPLLNAASPDPLIGNPNNSALRTTATSSSTTNIPNFAIRSEGIVTVNGSSDFDGVPSDYSDDALIYAGKGFNFNGSQILPVQRDALGNPIRDGQQRQVLVDKAVAVAAGYTISSGPSSQYAGLNPPQIVPTQTINVPAYVDVRDAELSRRIPSGTPTVTFNIAQNSIKNANDWNSKFPSAGTASNPKVVRVTGGALEIPANVNINNYVIIVETGNISFKGNNQNLNNVVFVANNGNIDLGNMKSTNLAAFASGSITMNGNARFTGGTTLASGSSTGSIAFNGASTSINAADGVRAISQGTISFSGASNTRGYFTSAKDFTFNGSSVLYGTISTKGNVTFNGSSVVIYAADPNLDTTPPVITAYLEQDTARNNTTNTDKITSNPTTIVSVTDASSIVELFARFNNNSNDTSILTLRDANGNLRLTRTQLEQINGGALPDGTHTLKIQAKDASGNTSNYEFTFTLDTTEPAPTNLDLTSLTDSGRSDSDNITNNTTPTITGNALAGANVQLFNSGQVIGQATADSTGKWQITSSTLTNGSYTLTATASDIAGNTSLPSQPLQIIIDTLAPTPPSNLKLTTATDTGTSNSDGITKNTNPTITGNAEANSIVKLYKDGLIIGQTTAAANGEWQVQLANLNNGQHVFTATATDVAGNISSPSTQYTITVDTQINPPSNLDLIATSDSGASNIDNITKITTPTITGNAEYGSIVQLFNSEQLLGQATTGNDGKWSITTSTITNGTYNLTAIATDIAGNISTPSTPLQITIDAALPGVTLTTSIDTQPLKQGTFLTGNVDGTGSSVIALQYRFDNLAVKDIPFSFTGVFNEQIDFTGISNGQHTLTIIATDTAGNTKTSIYNVTVALDKDAPVINASLQRDTAANGATNNDKITFDPSITGTVTDTSEIVEFLAGFGNNLTTNVLPYRNASGVFNFDRALLDTIKGATLPDGQHTLKLQAKDQYGNISAIFELTFTLDTTTPIPTLNLISTSDTGISNTDKITNDSTPTITGTSEVGATVQLYNGSQLVGETTANNSGVWQITTSDLTDGVKQLSVTVTDIAGNTNTGTPLGITVDTALPQLILTTPLEQTTLKEGAFLTGNINGTGSPITALTYRFNNLSEIPVTFNAAGTFEQTFDFTGLGNGTHTLTITATDTAGNILTSQYSVVVNLDTAAPIISASLARDTAPGNTTNNDGITFDATIVGSVLDTSEVVEFKAGFDNTPTSNFVNVLPQRNTNGTFTLSLSQLETIYGGTIPDGVRTLRLQSKDKFGNLSDIYSLTFTLDTTTQAPSNFDLPTIQDTGVSNSDNITKVNTPTITGNAEAGAIVRLINGDNGQLIGEVTANVNGIWQFNSNTLADGTYNITATATDIAGNISTPSSQFSITVDTTSPTLTLTTPLDTTPLQTGARLTGSVNGTGSSVATMTYRFNDGTIVPVVLNADGSFNQQLDLTGLANGNHTITITTTDVAGNVFTSSIAVTINIDVNAPVITASLVQDTAPGGATNSDRITSNPSIIGTVTDNSRVVELKAGLNNASTSNFVDITQLVQPNGSFTLNRAQLESIYGGTLVDGEITLKLIASDEFGNSQVFEYTFTLDTTIQAPINQDLPALFDSGVSNSDNITNTNTPTITGNAENGTTVQLFNNGAVVGEATTNNNGTWQIVTSVLTDGIYNLTAVATDIAGNVSTPSSPLQIIIDRAIPQLNLTTPVENTALTTGAKLVGTANGTGSAIASVTYRFDNASEIPIAFNTSGEFDQQLDLTNLTPGSHTLTVTVTDTAGNIKRVAYNVTVNNDVVAPVIAAGLANDTAPGGTTNLDKITFDPTITGTVTDTSSIDSLKAGFNNTLEANFIDVLSQLRSDGSFTFNLQKLETIYGGSLPDGAHTLRLIATDEYGNISQAFSFTFTLDTKVTQPVFNLDAASDSGTLGDRKTKFDKITLSGITEPGATLILEQSGATTTADNTGKYSFTSVNLVGGDNVFTVRATDIAGNTNTFSTTIYRFSAPTAINLTNNSVAENSVIGTFIGELSSVDADTGDTHSYTLIDNAGGRFKLVGNQLQVANGNLLDFETRAQHTVIIRSTDKNGLSKDQELTINVTNVNEAPIFTSTPNSTTIEAFSTFTYNITTTDPDAGDTRALTATGLPNWLTFIDNGDGTARITGTPNSSQLGLFNIAITATDGGGLKATQNIVIGSQITLREENNFSPERKFPLVVPTTPSILRFKIDPIFDNVDTDSINDAFEVALVDENGNSIVHTIASRRDAFFNLTEGENAVLGAGATYDSTTKTVSLNLTGVKAGNANLIFRLVNNDSDTTTNVKITDFAITAAPPNTNAPTQTTFAPEIHGGSLPNFNVLTDVSNSLVAEYGRTSFNSDTGLLYTDISIKNIGTYSVDAPLLVAIKNITNPSVILRGADGVTPDGIPYYDFTSLVTGGKLNKSGETLERTLVFYNPLDVQFDYDIVVLAQLNIKPVIESKPVTEVIAGKQYKYSVKATDFNGDALNYKLLAAPDGMSISTAGLITWDTTTSNKGNQSIVLEVSDGRGGVETQVFTLSVIEAPPNRPPQFTSTPVVDAYINKEYKYDADAVDPDENNPITYNLITGPDGMTVNPNTGVTEWTAPPVLNLGDTILGRIGVPGENDEFTFSGTKGQRIYFDPLQYTGVASNWRLDVYSPSGIKVIDGANFNWDSNQLITLLENGNYRVVVDAVGDFTGTYTFSVINTSLAPAVAFDNVVKGKLNLGTSDNVYRFTGNKGQKLYFDSLSNSGGLDWVLYNASNERIETNTSGNFNEFEIDLPSTGEYILAIRGNSELSGAVDYSFTIITPETITKPLALGSNANPNIISDAIKEKGEVHVYNFTGQLGQRLYLDAINSGYYTTKAYLYSPSGTVIFGHDLSRNNVGPFTLKEEGTYRLVIDSDGANTDAYSFSLLDVGQANLIQKDIDISGTLTPGNQTHFYKFTGNKDERLYLDSLLDGANTNWYVITSDNQIIKDTYSLGVGTDFEITLPYSGDYILVIAGNNSEPVNYNFKIITPLTKTDTTKNLNSDFSSEIVEKGERHIYELKNVPNDTRIFIDVLQESPGITASLVSAGGNEAFNVPIAGDNRFGTVLLLNDNNYQLIVDGTLENTGSYNFRFASLSNADILPIANANNLNTSQPILGALTPGSSVKAYKFTGSAGERLYFDSQFSSPDAAWMLIGPDNQRIVEPLPLSTDFEALLPGNGTYYIVLRGDGGETPIDYQIQVISSTTIPVIQNIGNVINGSIGVLGEQDAYTINVNTVGQRLYFDAQNGNSNITVKLVSPSGQDVWSGNTGADNQPIVLLETGDYSLIVDGYGDAIGDYKFRFIDTATAPTLTLGTPDNGSINPKETKLYRISGAAGQRLKLDSLTAVENAEWVLYTPGGLPPNGGITLGPNYQPTPLNNDFEVFLPATGIYTLAIRNNSETAINFDIFVSSQNSPTVFNTGFGSLKNGSVTEANSSSYTFTAASGTKFYFDSQIAPTYYYPVAVRIADSNGDTRILPGHDASFDTGLIQIDNDDTYTLTVSGSGDYSFSLIDLDASESLNFNTTTTLELNSSWETKAYKFTGRIGQKLFYDALNNNDPGVSVRLFSPGGREIFNIAAQSDRGIESGMTLAEAGDYYLVFSSNTGTPTSVLFRLLDASNQNVTTPIKLDSDVPSPEVNGDFETKLYRFNGTAGQYIFIDQQQGETATKWTLYGTGGQIIAGGDLPTDGEVQLSATGEYILAMQGNGAIDSSYKFRIVTPNFTTEPLIDINETFGDIQYGAITEKGENDTYTFNGTVGQQLFFDALNTNDPNFTVRVFTPTGKQLYAGPVQNDRDTETYSDYYSVYPGFTLTESGEYRIVIDGNGEAIGDYSFRLLDKADAKLIDLNNEEDKNIEGTFALGGVDSHLYRFTGTAGQYLYFDTTSGEYPNKWILYKPDGKAFSSNEIYNDNEFALTGTGEYLLVIQGKGATNQNYKLRIVTPEFKETQLEFNKSVLEAISKPGENDTYYFDNNNVGQQLYFDALNTNTTNITVRLFNSSGNEVYRGPLESNRGPETTADYYGVYPGFVLTETGRYRLIIDGNGDTTGAYNFRLLTKPEVSVPELLDRDITGDFGASGKETDLYTFTGTAGQYIYIDMIGGNYHDYWTLYGPGGEIVTYNLTSYDSELALPATGEYMFAMYGSGNGSTNYTYHLVTPDFETKTLNFNEQISSSIGEPGENDTYTFDGTVGQQLYFDALNANDPNFTVRIISPSGKEIYSGRVQDDRGSETIIGYYGVYPGLILNETGSFRLIIDGNGDSTGDYSFRLLNISTSTPLIIDTDITQSFGTLSRETDVYRFSATAGEYIYIDNIDGNYRDYWTLYSPGGQVVTGNHTAHDGELALPTTGEYILAMYGSGQGNENYTIHVTKPISGNSPLTLNSTTRGSISKRGENDTYTFNGTAGQQLFFDAIAGTSSIKARLISPSGVTIVDKDTLTDRGAFNLGETGAYRLVIDGEGATVGDYGFRLLDHNSALQVKFGATDFNQGSINPGNQVNLYKFNGKSGQRLNFNLDADIWNGANWILYDPSGQAIRTPDINNPDFNVTLGAAGLYTLAIIGNSDTPVNYKFTVTDTSTAPITNNGIGLVQSGTLNANEVIDYQFTANAGTQIIFDGQFGSLSNNYFIRARLLNPDGTYVFDNHVTYEDTTPIVLEQSGNYKVQVYGYYGDTTGAYKFNLLELPRTLRSPNLNYLEIGGVDDGTLNAGQGKVYTFDGVQGQKVLFNAMVGESVTATLYDAHGNKYFERGNFRWDGDSAPLTLTTTGLHYLVVKNDDISTERDYSFQLLDSSTSQSIAYSLPVSGSLDNGQTSKIYKLQATKGERLYFDNISSNTPSDTYWYRWKLYGHGTDPLFDNELLFDAEIIIPETLEYYLEIQGGNSTEKVDYNFRVLRHSEPIRDVITPGNGLESNNNTDSQGIFNVKLSAKDSLGAESIQEYNIKLWADPTNSNPVITSTAKTKFSLADKVYQYKLTGVDPDNDPLVYRLLDAPLGALIDNETGELLWFPEANITPGSQVNFKVEVSDRRGGKDIQTFAVDVYGNLGKIQGAVFDDLNGNGLLDSKLVKGDNPAIVFAIDVSGSTAAPFFGDESNPNVKTVLDAQVAAVEAMVDAVIAQGAGDKVKFGIIPHKFNAVIQDMDNATPGLQIYTTATADTNNNGIADIREILASYRPDGSNNFTTALQTIDSLFDALPGDPNLIFMSDGYGPLDPTVASTVVADIKAKGGNVTAFGVGLYSTIETIKKIDPNAEQITDFNRLISIFSGFDDRYAIEPLKENVTVYLDLNNNGVLDKNEPSRITKKNNEVSILGTNKYNYTFDDLLPGTYTVRTVVPAGYNLTTPLFGAFIDTITVGGEDYRHLAGIGKVSEPVNVDPIFVTTPDKYRVKAGENLIYRALATDANADPLNYDLILAPPGMTLDRTAGTVVWSPTKQIIEQYYTELFAERERLTALGRGEFARNTVELNVGLRVRDGKGGQALQYINVELLPDNIAPVFTSAPKINKAQVDKTFRYQATALNTDGDALVYSLTEGASLGVNITNTGLVTWTPNSTQLGNQEFTIKVTDGKGGEALQRVSVVVGANLPNTAPDITSTPRTVVRQGNTYFYKVEANDVDGDALTYSLATKPTGMEITQDGFISWTPTAAQFGNYTVSLDVSDGALITNQSFTLNVTNFAANNAPTITSTPNLVTNLERTYEYNLIGTDPDNDLLLWSLDNAPDGMVIDAITGALRWQPLSTQIGEHTVLVRATDAYGAYVGQEFTLTARGTNTPPAIVSTPVTIAAQNQVYTYNVVATDVENDELTYSLGRRPIGMTITDEGKVEWKPLSNQIGSHTVEVIARDSQGATSTQTFTIEVGTTAINNAPAITSTPKFVATVGSPYSYQVIATDKDAGDTLTYQILSKPDNIDVRINSTTGLLTWENPIAGLYQIVVGAVDKGGLGAAQRFTLTARNNSNPVINSTAPTTVTPDSTYAYDVKAIDADGDNLTYSLDSISSDKGITVDALGRLRWAPTISNAGNHAINVTVNDGNGGSANQEINLTVARDTMAPLVRLIALNNTANLGDDITFQARATDNVKLASLQLLVDGTPVILDANGIVTVKASRSGTISAVAIATDTSGNTKQETFDVTVIDPSNVNPPTVTLQPLTVSDGFITAPTSIRGSISDDGTLSYYRLLVAPVWAVDDDGDSDEFTEIKRVNNPTAITNGILGTLDPSLLQNDTYVVRLEVADSGDNISYTDQTVDVTGDLKLGNFRLSFTDLTVPVTGIPITLTRTYDTLTSNTRDDFGYGWRMEFRDTDLRTSLGKPTEEDDILGYQRAFKDGTKVYITLPGGKREAFTFRPTLDRIFRIAAGISGNADALVYHPAFVADKGGTSTLTVKDTKIIKRAGSNEYVGFDAAGVPYNPADINFGTVYVLTTKEGIVYEIDARTGDLLTVTDTNGNKLTYTDAGITSSTGKQITFERDTAERITAVLDPMGYLIKYDYDTKGDLVSVTDREGNVTRMEYNTQRPHYLDKIIDPLGRTGVRNEYDDITGRLKEIFDVNGKKVEMTYDTNTSRQIVKDARDYETVYIYDERGNILQEIDPVGKVTKRTYDDDNNLKTETIITDESGSDGYTTTYTYDSKGNQLTRTNPLSQTEIYTYNSLSKLLTSTNALGHTTTYTYDSRGNVTSKTDATGNKTTYNYYANGNPWTITEGLNDITTFEYDSFGNRAKKTDALSNVITYTYDLNGNQETETRKLTTPTGVRTLVTTQTYDRSGKVKTVLDAENALTQYDYDVNGNQILVIDALGRRTNMRYNEKNQMTEMILPDNTPDNLLDNPRIKYDYDAAGNRTAITDQDGRTTSYTYDPLNRPTGMILPDATPNNLTDNPRITVEYNKAGQMKALIKDGIRTEFEYDAAGDMRLTRNIKNGQVYETSTVYDKAGRKVSTTDALNRTTKFVYDGLDRLVEMIYVDNTSTKTTYNAAGKVLTQTDQFGRVTRYEYDALDQLRFVIDAKQNRTEYQYDEAGNLVYQKDANNNITRFEYDGLGRRTAVVRPMLQRSTTVYNKVGNVIETTDFNGDKIKYDYDLNNRLISKQFLNENNRLVEFTYTAAGKRDTVKDSLGITDYDYDIQGRIIKVTNPDNKDISYTYDSVTGKLASLTTSDGTTNYQYNSLGQLEKVIAFNGETSYNYNAVGNLEKVTLPNGNTQNYKYNKLNQLEVLETKDRNNNLIAKYTYTYDKVGNTKLVEELGGRKVEFDYDELNRLTLETITDPVNGNRIIEYVYDNVGNRLTRRDSLQGETTYVYDINDRLRTETIAGVTTTYNYDNNGNVTGEVAPGQQVVYDWDSENRLIGANITNGNVTRQLGYKYDADGNRVAAIVDGQETRYLVDTNRQYAEVVSEYTPSGQTQATYVHGLDLISLSRGSNSNFYLYDRHSGVRQLSNAAGVVTDTYNYDAYGNLLQSTGSTQNNYLYRGEQIDSNLGMQYLRARYYNQNQGRFASVDPFEGFTEQPMTRHRYIYGNDNPITYIDPSGAITSAAEFGAVLSILDILATLGTGLIFQGAAALLFEKDRYWEGVFGYFDLPAITIGGVGYLNATSQTIPEYSGSWIIVGSGIGQSNGQNQFQIPLAKTVLKSPSIVGIGPQTFTGEFAFIGGQANGLTSAYYTIGFGQGVISQAAPPGGDKPDAGFGAYVGLSIPIPSRVRDGAITVGTNVKNKFNEIKRGLFNR